MSPEENKALIRRATDEFWNNPNQEAALAAVAEFYAPDFIDHVHPRDRSSDLEDVKQIYTSWRASFPDWHFTLETVMAEGDVVAIQGTAHGTHRGAFMGIAPTGKRPVGACFSRCKSNRYCVRRGAGTCAGFPIGPPHSSR